MRSTRAFNQLLRQPRVSYAINPTQKSGRRAYCAVCDSAKPTAIPGSDQANKTTKNPPIPPADHRQIGIEQELFTTSIYSPGSPLFLPNGTKIFNKLTDFLRAQYEQFGFQEVITPTIYKKSLWEKSGHWENYADDMYAVVGRGASGQKENRQVGEDEEYGLKPMNCPGHCLIFASKQRSYRDLPIRYADFSPLHRNEVHGALSGLTRVRRFHQDDGHIFCRPSQIREEISKTLEFVKMTYKVLGLGPYRLALSTRPKENVIGTIEEWDNAEAGLRESLDASGMDWVLNEGDGAFYGPKIDIILKDTNGKEHQTATIQLDFQLPKRFELSYQAADPEYEQKGLTPPADRPPQVEGPVTPVLIHRAVLGSVERIMALLIEHYNGKWPFWLSPRQVKILTLNDTPEVVAYAERVSRLLRQAKNPEELLSKDSTSLFLLAVTDIRPFDIQDRLTVDIDDSATSLKHKVKQAKLQRYSVIVVVGGKDIADKKVTVDLSGLTDFNSSVEEEAEALEHWKLFMKKYVSSSILPAKLEDFGRLTVAPAELAHLLWQLQRYRFVK